MEVTVDLVLFRHGIAVERQEWSGKEQDRPLTGTGLRKTRRAVKGLLNLRITPTHLFSSPLARARETADILKQLIRPRMTVQLYDELLPTASPLSLFALLSTLPADSVVLCVGHEPHLSLVASTILSGEPCSGLSLKKAGACLLHLEQPIRPGQGLLQWWLTSSQLRAFA
jgi:phosphohistidine phosphatase